MSGNIVTRYIVHRRYIALQQSKIQLELQQRNQNKSPNDLLQDDDWLKWRKQLSEMRCNFHLSVELTGLSAALEYLSLGLETGIERDCTLWFSPDSGSEPKISVGDRCFIGRNSYIGAYQPITIGSNTLIGAYSYIISANHRFERRDIPIRDQGFTGAPIIIADDVWIGTHVVILPGVHIGQGAIIAAGSIVNRNVPPFEIWGGTPAKYIKARP